MKPTVTKRNPSDQDQSIRQRALPWSIRTVLVLGMMLASLPARAELPLVYDANSGSPDPRSQGWDGVEIVIRSDADVDGLVDSPGNTGPVAGIKEGEVAWQLHDQRSEPSVNVPKFRIPVSATDQAELLATGWVYSVRVKVARNGSGSSFDSFFSWGLTDFMGSSRRIGFAIGQGASSSFFVREDSNGLTVDLGPNSVQSYHTVEAFGAPGALTYDWYIDGTHAGTRGLLDNTISNGGMVEFQSGSSALINAASNWLSVSLDTWTPRDDTIGLPNGSARSVARWVPPASVGTYPITHLGSSGTLAFTSLPEVDANGTLLYTPAAGTSGSAAFDVEMPDGPVRFYITANNLLPGLTPQFAFDYTASQFVTSHASTARIRAWRHAPGERKGIAIFPSGFGPIPTFPTPANDTHAENGKKLTGYPRVAFSEGFDVWTVDWHDPLTYIEDNAGVLIDILDALNFPFPAGLGPPIWGFSDGLKPGEKLVLVGQSMGGLISRYALCYLDTHLAHPCDLFLSVDSPQEGANIPIGLQRVAKYLDNLPSNYTAGFDTAALAEVLDSMNSISAKQMLLLHVDRANSVGMSHAVERDHFLALLAAVGDWPTNPKLRMAAIANGRGDGQLQDGTASRSVFTIPKSNYLTLDWNAAQREIHDDTSFVNAPTCFVGSLRVEVLGNLRMRSFAINPVTNPGTSTIFRGESKVTVRVWGTEYDIFGNPTSTVHTGETLNFNTSGSFAAVKLRLRNWIKANGTPNGPTCGILDAGIDSAIHPFINDLVEAGSLNQVHTASSSYHWDQVPGAFRTTGRFAADALGSGGDVAYVSEYHTFIPTVSALAIDGSVPAHSVVIPADAVEDSPFHALYHFGSHSNTGHLEDFDGWLSDILVHELRVLCNEFALELGDVPNTLSWHGLYQLEENSGLNSGWSPLLHRRHGVYPIPVPTPSRGFYRLGFHGKFE